MCHSHRAEVEFFCEEPKCRTLICSTCLREQHSGHRATLLLDYATGLEDTIKQHLTKFQQKLSANEAQRQRVEDERKHSLRRIMDCKKHIVDLIDKAAIQTKELWVAQSNQMMNAMNTLSAEEIKRREWVKEQFHNNRHSMNKLLEVVTMARLAKDWGKLAFPDLQAQFVEQKLKTVEGDNNDYNLVIEKLKTLTSEHERASQRFMDQLRNELFNGEAIFSSLVSIPPRSLGPARVLGPDTLEEKKAEGDQGLQQPSGRSERSSTSPEQCTELSRQANLKCNELLDVKKLSALVRELADSQKAFIDSVQEVLSTVHNMSRASGLQLEVVKQYQLVAITNREQISFRADKVNIEAMLGNKHAARGEPKEQFSFSHGDSRMYIEFDLSHNPGRMYKMRLYSNTFSYSHFAIEYSENRKDWIRATFYSHIPTPLSSTQINTELNAFTSLCTLWAGVSAKSMFLISIDIGASY